MTATALAEELGLTVPAVRRHLDNLAESGLIEGQGVHVLPEQLGSRSSRALLKILSEGGHLALESDYDHLATRGPAVPLRGGRP